MSQSGPAVSVTLVLPAYNEERSLPSLFDRLRKLRERTGIPHRLLVVDDGSTDGTRQVLEQWAAQMPLEVLEHPENRGLGETIRDGLAAAAAAAAPADMVVSMDADDTHSPAAIPGMLKLLEEGCDVVVGSRYQPGSRVIGLSAFRASMTQGARAMFQLLFPIPGVSDYTSGYRAYRAGILREMFERYPHELTEPSFACMAEILLTLRAMGARMREYPLVLDYERKSGPSKMNVPRTVLKTLFLAASWKLGGRPREKATPAR